MSPNSKIFITEETERELMNIQLDDCTIKTQTNRSKKKNLTNNNNIPCKNPPSQRFHNDISSTQHTTQSNPIPNNSHNHSRQRNQ